MHMCLYVCIYIISSCSIHPDLKSVVYSAGIAFGDVEQWDFLWNIYQTTNDTAEKDICLGALANVRIPWLLTRYIVHTYAYI